jgi:hypothetical protein
MKFSFFLDMEHVITPEVLRVLSPQTKDAHVFSDNTQTRLELDVESSRPADQSKFFISGDKKTLYWGMQWIGTLNYALLDSQLSEYPRVRFNDKAPRSFANFNELDCGSSITKRPRLLRRGEMFQKSGDGNVTKLPTHKEEHPSEDNTLSMDMKTR